MTTDYTDKIRLIGFQEMEFQVKGDVKITKNMLQEMSISLQPILRYRTDSDLVGVQVGIAYEYKKEKLLPYGVILTFWITDWTETAKGITAAKRPDGLVMQSFEITVWFIRGTMSIHARKTSFDDTFLPIINFKDYAMG